MICKHNLLIAASGALAATLGVRILRSEDAKKLYTAGTAAVLREKEYIMTGIADIKADCGDILADAKELNKEYAKKKERIIEDRADRSLEE